MDWSLLHALNTFAARHDLVEDPITAYVGVSEVLFAALLVVLFLFRNARAAVHAGFASALALGAGQIVTHLYDRPRPFVTHGGAVHVFVHHSADASFPSDHATAAFAIATAIVLRSRRWGIPALVLAAALAVGRVVDGVHYPSDVTAGAVLGAIAALVLYAPALRRPLDAFADSLARARDAVYARVSALAGS